MTSMSLKLYYNLPVSLRSVAASIRGFYLRSWRYGPETERLAEEAISRESWSPDRWRAWHEVRLAYVLHRAATQVPYYREQWAERRRRGDQASWEYLENWPILEKDTIRENARAFVADDCDLGKMFHEQTSGMPPTLVLTMHTPQAIASNMLTGVLSILGVLSRISPRLIHSGVVALGTGPTNVILSITPSFIAKFLAKS